MLRCRAARLSEKAAARLQAALAADDPYGEVIAALICAQDLARVYLAPDPGTGRRRALDVIQALLSCPVSGARRLGRTLRFWQEEFLAYFDTNGASSGPTEAVNLIVEETRRLGRGFPELGQLPATPPAALWRNSLGYILDATGQKAPSTFGGVYPD